MGRWGEGWSRDGLVMVTTHDDDEDHDNDYVELPYHYINIIFGDNGKMRKGSSQRPKIIIAVNNNTLGSIKLVRRRGNKLERNEKLIKDSVRVGYCPRLTLHRATWWTDFLLPLHRQ